MLARNKNGMGIRELIKTSFEVYCKNIVIWVVICLLVYLPFCVRDYVMSVSLNSIDLTAVKRIDDILEMIKSFGVRGILWQLIFLLPRFFFAPIGMAAISFVVKESLSKKTVVVSEVLDNSLLKWKKLLLASFFYNILALISLCLVFPVVFFVSFYFYPVVIALSNCGVLGSMIASHVSLGKHLIGSAIMILFTKLLALIIVFLFSCLINNFLPMESNFVLYSLIVIFFRYMVFIFFNVVLIIWFLNMFSVEMINLMTKKFGDIRDINLDINKSDKDKDKNKD